MDLRLLFSLSVVLLPFASACSSSTENVTPEVKKNAQNRVSTISKVDIDSRKVDLKIELEIQKLENGLTIVMVEDHSVPVVSYQSWFKVGSVDEVLGITGVSHLFEHLMFKGTDKNGKQEFVQQLEAKGAEVNAFTTRDYTVYYENFTPNLLSKVVEMEADRLSNINFTQEDLDTERQVVFEERRLRTDNSPAGRMQEALWQLSYQFHPYQWPVIGYLQDVATISLKQLKDFFKKHYHPGSLTVVVVGDIEKKKLMEVIKKNYETIPKQQFKERDIPLEPKQTSERRLKLYDQVASEQFAYGYVVSSAANDESYAIDVLANILFFGSSSRAYQQLVEEEKLLIGISGSAYTPTYPGLFSISGTARKGVKVSQAEKVLEKLFNDIKKNGVSESEVNKAVRQLTMQIVDSVRTPYGLAQMLGTVHTILGDANRFRSDFTKYLTVTPQAVKSVAEKYLDPNNRATVVMVPRQVE